MTDRISFVASLAQVAAAIRISDEGAVRLQLDIPESELPSALRLVTLKGQAFRVTIEGEGE